MIRTQCYVSLTSPLRRSRPSFASPSMLTRTGHRDAGTMVGASPGGCWSGYTSSRGSHGTAILRYGPYPARVGVGPVGGDGRGHRGLAPNPDPDRQDQGGKGVKGSVFLKRIPPPGPRRIVT